MLTPPLVSGSCTCALGSSTGKHTQLRPCRLRPKGNEQSGSSQGRAERPMQRDFTHEPTAASELHDIPYSAHQDHPEDPLSPT